MKHYNLNPMVNYFMYLELEMEMYPTICICDYAVAVTWNN